MHLRKLHEKVDHNKTGNVSTRITFTLWRLPVIFTLPRLSQQPDNISLEKSALIVI